MKTCLGRGVAISFFLPAFVWMGSACTITIGPYDDTEGTGPRDSSALPAPKNGAAEGMPLDEAQQARKEETERYTRDIGGGRVEHPVEPDPTKAKPLPTVHGPASGSAAEMSAPSEDRRPSRSDYFEKRTGFKLSPLDKAIMDACPARAWSTNVPKRHCANDDECGDGFCDRGQCSAIWSCGGERYGQRCNKQDHCGIHLCIDGRCRSCSSNTECALVPELIDAKCMPDAMVPGAHECNGFVPSIPGDAAPGPLPKKPK